MNSIKTNYNFHVLGAPYYYEQKKQLGDVDIELLIAAFPSFYRQYVIENPNSSL